jgi:glutamate 5-kinase
MANHVHSTYIDHNYLVTRTRTLSFAATACAAAKAIRVCLADQLAVLIPSASVLEDNAGEIALAPNQPALPDGVKIVEGQFKIGRQDVDVVQPNSGADIGDVAYAAAEYTALGAKKQQGAPCNPRPAN